MVCPLEKFQYRESTVVYAIGGQLVCFVMHVSFISEIIKFDLSGEFGPLDLLGNFRVVILYNLVFEVSTAFCLVNKFTASVRNALYEQVHVPTMQFLRRLRPKAKASV